MMTHRQAMFRFKKRFRPAPAGVDGILSFVPHPNSSCPTRPFFSTAAGVFTAATGPRTLFQDWIPTHNPDFLAALQPPFILQST